MRFQPVKCNIMQLTRKWIKKINTVYSFAGTVIENVDNIMPRCDNFSRFEMEYSCKQCLHKSKQNSCFISRNLSSCPKMLKKWHTKGGATNPGLC